MEKFEFNKIDTGFYSIEQGGVRSFLFVDDYLLLIDSGLGGNDLLKQIRDFSDLPLKTIFTHADRDHVGDAKDFDNRYMHPSEYDYYSSKSEYPVPMQPIWEGDIISIGKYEFEVILIPGHTPGSICLLDRNNRFVIGGDSLQGGPIFMFGPGRNFEAFKSSMIKLQKVKDFDWIYSSHHQLKVPVSIIDQLLAGADKMILGELEGVPEARFEGKVKRYSYNNVAFFAQ